MADRPIDINLTKSTKTNVAQTESVSEIRARVARVLERGLLVDRFQVDLPADVHGEWVPDDPVEIQRKMLLGFEIDTQYATNRSLNDKGDGKAVVGDVIHMTCPKIIYEAICDHRREQYRRNHLSSSKVQKEERDFLASNQGMGMDTEVSSNATAVTGSDIKDTLKG